MKKIIEFGTYLIIFFLPWQTRFIFHQGIINGNPNELLTTSLYAIDILIILIFLVFILSHLKDKSLSSEIGLEVKMIFAFILLAIFSFFWGQDAMLGIQRVGWLVFAVFLAVLVVKNENKIDICFWFLMGLMLNAWLGIWQFLSQASFSNKWLGLAKHDPAEGGTSIVEIYSNGNAVRWLRAYGSFDHPNVLGAMMVIGIISVLWMFHKNKIQGVKNVLLWSALLSFSTGTFMSLSRSAWIGLFLALSVLTVRILIENKQKEILQPMLFVAIIFISLAFAYPNQFMMRSGGQGRLEAKSLNDRAVYFQQGKEIIRKNPIFGVGVGNYIEALLAGNSKNDAWAYQPVHNVIFYVWAELGLVGAAFFVTILIFTGILGWKNDAFVFAALACLAPSLLTDHWLWDLHYGVLFFGLLLGLVFGSKNGIKIKF